MREQEDDEASIAFKAAELGRTGILDANLPVKQEAHKSAIHGLVKHETCLQSRQMKERLEL